MMLMTMIVTMMMVRVVVELCYLWMVMTTITINLWRIKGHIELVGAWVFSQYQWVRVKTFNKIIVIITIVSNFVSSIIIIAQIITINEFFNSHSCVARCVFPLVGHSFSSK